jgi:transglutaminase-like putative cysteine protease
VHETHYRFAMPAQHAQQVLRLTPRSFQFQHCEFSELLVAPIPSEHHRRVDYFGNLTDHVVIAQYHERLEIRARATVWLAPRPQTELLAGSMPWEQVRDGFRSVGDPGRLEPLKSAFSSPHVALGEELYQFALPSFGPGSTVLQGAFALMQRIHDEFVFDPLATDISTPLSQVLAQRRGVCQDFAHLMIGGLRALGLSARYVSGYIQTHPAPGRPRLVGADASHAWVSVYCPSIGWVDFDPTNRCMVDTEHITLGWGRDFSDVSPARGILQGGGAQELTVKVTVNALDEATQAPAALQAAS